MSDGAVHIGALDANLPQPHAGAAAIVGDELDAGRFEGGAECRPAFTQPSAPGV